MHETSGIDSAAAGSDASAEEHARPRVAGVHARLWSVGQRSETGYVRSENQDRMSWIRARAADVFVVSDGMGGHAGGSTAATLTVQTLQDELQALDLLTQADQALTRALQAANAVVHARGQTSNPTVAGMGATAVLLLVAGKQVMVAHVGDSRAYRLDRRGVLHRLTKDHSFVQRLVDAGTLTSLQAEHHPDASVLERALGPAPRVTADVSGWIAVQRGELYMLCSDGLCGYVDDDKIASSLREGGTPQAIADRLVKLALDAGGEDNVTVQVLRCGDEHRVNWRRRIGRGALALAALCAAAAAMVWTGWLGFNTDRHVAGGDATKASGPTVAGAKPGINSGGGATDASGVSGAAGTSGASGASGASDASNATGAAAVPASRPEAESATNSAASIDTLIASLEQSRQAAAERFRQDDARSTQKIAALRKERDAMRGGAASGAADALISSNVASESNGASAPGAGKPAVTLDAVQGVNATQQASASAASNDTSNTRSRSGAAHHPVAASAPKHPPKRAHRPMLKPVIQGESASPASDASKPQSAGSDSQPVEIKQ